MSIYRPSWDAVEAATVVARAVAKSIQGIVAQEQEAVTQERLPLVIAEVLKQRAEEDPDFADALVGWANEIEEPGPLLNQLSLVCTADDALTLVCTAGDDALPAESVDQGLTNQLRGGVSLLPVTIYLSEVEGHERVESAVENLLAAADLSIDSREDPVIGSWFIRMWATLIRTAKSPGVREEALAVKHILDQQLILGRDADITARLLQNLGPVVVSLQPTKDAVVRVGAILIVKVDWVVQILQLTAAQQAVLDHQPHLAASPHEILAALRVTSEKVNGSNLRLPKGLPVDI